MPRSGLPARRQLQQAALELFEERGYEATTTADIAERAGVNHRTFFRHFPDKREVLFEGEELLRDRLVAALVALPADVAPVPALRQALRAAFPGFEANRTNALPRVAAIDRHAALRERAGAKQAYLASALAAALETRGTEPAAAAMIAGVAMIAFTQATHDWLDDPSIDLGTRLDHDLVVLRDLLAGGR